MSVVLTYDDYVALPNDGRRYEIHDGELSVTPSPTFRQLFEPYGVPFYWIVDADAHTIEVFALTSSVYGPARRRVAVIAVPGRMISRSERGLRPRNPAVGGRVT